MKESSAEIVVAGHICLDIIPAIRQRKGGMDALLVPGKLVDIGPALTATGGAVPNAGVALHKLGVPTRLMGKVGDDLFGKAILDLLREHGGELADGMIVVPGEESSYTIVISPPAVDRIFLHCTGANDTFSADDLKYEDIAAAKLFHFGYPPLMRRMYEDGGANLQAMMARVKALGVTTSLDMAKPDPESAAGGADWPAILQAVLPEVDIFLPSFDEIFYMLDRERYEAALAASGGGDLLDQADGALLEELSGRILALGTAVVAIKLGEHGLYVRTTGDRKRMAALGKCTPADIDGWLNRELLAPCFSVQVAGTTGAGDCTIAGFLAGFVHALPLEGALISAVGVGGCNVEQADATSGIPSWAAVRERIQSGWAQRENKLSLPGWQYNAEHRIWASAADLITAGQGNNS